MYGEAVLDPAELLKRVDSDIIMLLGSAVFVVATIGVNIVANFVSAAYDLSNVNPKRISFRKGGIITSILALVSMPWNLYNSPEVIAYFLGGLGALLGPFFGILALDYFWYRKGRFSIPDLYLPTPESKYYYRNGVNPQAVIAFVPSAAIALILALVPTFEKAQPSAPSPTTSSPAVSHSSKGRSRRRSRAPTSSPSSDGRLAQPITADPDPWLRGKKIDINDEPQGRLLSRGAA